MDNQGGLSTRPVPKPVGNGFGVASLVFGIVALIGLWASFAPFTGALAIGLGAIQISRTPNNKTYSLIGIITGAIGILLALVILFIWIKGITIDIPMDGSTNPYQEIMDLYEL